MRPNHRDATEDAWDSVHEALPARWLVGRASVGDALRQRWTVSARGPHPGRGRAPQTVTGEGNSEVEALRDLSDQLRGIPKPDGDRMQELRARLRLAYLTGAEERSRKHIGPPLSESEAVRVIHRFPSEPR